MKRRIMRAGWAFSGICALTGLAGCALILGLDDYTLICPPDDPACTICGTSADCGPQEACRLWECVGNVCKLRYDSPGAGCSGGVCDYNARCVTCFRDTDCAQGAYCHENECYRCDDGVQNGDEWDVDCDGAHCPGCLGSFCHPEKGCKDSYCADGNCCSIPCNDICTFCDLDGECKYVPQGLGDSPLCDGDMACNGGGACAKRNGEPCTGDGECASLKCTNMVCGP